MTDSFSNDRRHQIIFVVLLAVCLAQVGWWMLDQWTFSADVQQRLLRAHQRDLGAARALITGGAAAQEVVANFPFLVVSSDGTTVEIDPGVVEALANERGSRINRYAWEGGFFLVVLIAAIGVLWRALRTEQRLRRRQHNFVTAVTHELKSPLASVRLSAETLQYRDADETTRARLTGRLLRSLDRMDVTVSNILDTARIDEGQLRLTPQRLPLEPCLKAAVDSLDGAGFGEDAAVRVAADDDLFVFADPRAVDTVLRNLLANAVEAVSDTDDPQVTVTASRATAGTTVEVRDNGRGFDPDDAGKLFDRFYRLGEELRREGRGTGLGLYIARSVADESNGVLSAHSDGPGLGAVFRVVWPDSAPGNDGSGASR